MKKYIVSSIVTLLCSTVLFAGVYQHDNTDVKLSLKVPGNKSEIYTLYPQKLSGSYFDYEWVSDKSIPIRVYHKLQEQKGGTLLNVQLVADCDVYFNYSQRLKTGFKHDDCLFYMPGFWYRRNLRSPKKAPSFHTSDSWMVREDRLSAPLTGIYDESRKFFVTVNRMDELSSDALTTHKEGEVILSGNTSIGFTGFENIDGIAALSFGFPYKEAPKSYIRKLTFTPKVEAFQLLKKGETLSLTWALRSRSVNDYSDFIRQTWEYCYDIYAPDSVDTPYSTDDMKRIISNYFTSSLVENSPLVYNSGVHLQVADCNSVGIAEVGFVGRVLLNAFNAWEYGWQTGQEELKSNSMKVFNSYLKNGFTNSGFFREFVDFDNKKEETVLSIRRQSEGLYAMLHFWNTKEQTEGNMLLGKKE